MPTNKQRRDAQRRHLERQLERRREREVRRRKTNLVISIVGTLVVIAAIVLTVVLISGDDDKKPAANPTKTGSPTPTTATSSPSAPPSTSYPPAAGTAVTFNGVTVKGAADLKGYPVVTSKEGKAPTAIEVKDLVVGKGKAAAPTDTVTVQYYGVLYKDGTYFDSSWKRGAPTQFPLTGVVPGFTQGIGGNDSGVAPMKEGGRRIIIVPYKDGYGEAGQAPIPGKADLVFIVDLKSIDT